MDQQQLNVIMVCKDYKMQIMDPFQNEILYDEGIDIVEHIRQTVQQRKMRESSPLPAATPIEPTPPPVVQPTPPTVPRGITPKQSFKNAWMAISELLDIFQNLLAIKNDVRW